MVELDPALVYERIIDAITEGTGLQVMDTEAHGPSKQPHPLKHRHFRISDDEISFPPSRARPGDVILIEQRPTIQLLHEVIPNDRKASLREAGRDFIALLGAVLTRIKLSGLAQPVAATGTVTIDGDHIVTTLRLQVIYHVTLPEAA